MSSVLAAVTGVGGCMHTTEQAHSVLQAGPRLRGALCASVLIRTQMAGKRLGILDQVDSILQYIPLRAVQ